MSRARQPIQQQHEGYWIERWAEVLGQRMMNALVRVRRPESDPPDAWFHVSKENRTEMITWGEVTCAYYDNREAEDLWKGESASWSSPGNLYAGPDETIAAFAEEVFEKKRGKYVKLVEQYGRGHLLVVLISPFSTRSTRVNAEERIREQLRHQERAGSGQFETAWLGYELPWTSPDEQEDPEYAFQDPTPVGRFNFLKCIGPAQA